MPAFPLSTLVMVSSTLCSEEEYVADGSVFVALNAASGCSIEIDSFADVLFMKKGGDSRVVQLSKVKPSLGLSRRGLAPLKEETATFPTH